MIVITDRKKPILDKDCAVETLTKNGVDLGIDTTVILLDTLFPKSAAVGAIGTIALSSAAVINSAVTREKLQE